MMSYHKYSSHPQVTATGHYASATDKHAVPANIFFTKSQEKLQCIICYENLLMEK